MATESFIIDTGPVIEVSLFPASVIEVTVEKLGPQSEEISDHIASTSNPHGHVLTQDEIDVLKAAVGIIDGGVVSTSQVIDFDTGGCYKCSATGTINLDVSSLGAGQRGSVHVLAGSSAPNVTWLGVDVWIGGVPTFVGNTLTVVTLFNDGTRIIGSAGHAV